MLDRHLNARTTSLILPLLALIVGCRGPLILSADDAVVVPGSPVRLTAFLEEEPSLGIRDGWEDAPVEFRVNGEVVAVEKTQDEGEGVAVLDTLPADVREFSVRASARGETLETKAKVFHWHADRTIVAVDIDYTIADTDLDDLIFDTIDRDSEPIPGARETLEQLAHDYHILYLTARPRFVLDKTHEWLNRHGFPDGPVLTSPKLRNLMRQSEYKQQVLAQLREDWPSLLIGIGDEENDAEAYGATGLVTIIIPRETDDEFPPHTLVMRDWPAVAELFERNHALLSHPEQLRKFLGSHPPSSLPQRLQTTEVNPPQPTRKTANRDK